MLILRKVAVVLSCCVVMLGARSVRAGWLMDGTAICTAIWDQLSPRCVSDGAGGVIIAWIDERSGPFGADPVRFYAQRIDANGSALWAADGVLIGTANASDVSLRLVSDGSGGAIAAWWDGFIYAQRVSPNGSLLWTAGGVDIYTGTEEVWPPAVASDALGGVLIAWADARSGVGLDIYAQRVIGNGSVAWASNGVGVCLATGEQNYPHLTSDGSGGAIIAWQDNRSGGNVEDADIYARRVNSNGSLAWVPNGVPICSASDRQWFPVLVVDGSGGAIITWMDYRTEGDIYAQRVDGNGSALWPLNGVIVCAATGLQMGQRPISDGAGGAIVAWQDQRDGFGDFDIYAQRVDGSGAGMWAADGVAISTATDFQLNAQMIADGFEGAVIAWEDRRINGYNYDIYVQKISENGVCAWMPDGVPICTNKDGDSHSPSLAPDGSGGAIMAWHNNRSGNYDIYAQRVDAAGHTAPDVATLLQAYAVTFSEAGILLTWTLSEIDEESEFFVERATSPNGAFSEVPSGGMVQNGLSFSITDGDWKPNTSYWYRVEYSIGNSRKTLFETGAITTPAMPLTLHQNTPNPFNPSTRIRYYLPEKCRVALDVYAMSGALVARLVQGDLNAGSHTAAWEGRDGRGRPVSSGVYFCRLRAGKTEISRKLVLAR